MSRIPEKVMSELAIKTNAIHSLGIIQEGLIKEIESTLKRYGQFRYEFKHHVNNIRKQSELLRAEIYKADPVNADEYGQDADEIEERINELIKSML